VRSTQAGGLEICLRDDHSPELGAIAVRHLVIEQRRVERPSCFMGTARVVKLAQEKGAQAAVFVGADLLDAASTERILQEAAKLGPLHVLVNNVGGNAGLGLFAESDSASWQAHIDLSLMTMLRMTRAALPGMIERKTGAHHQHRFHCRSGR